MHVFELVIAINVKAQDPIFVRVPLLGGDRGRHALHQIYIASSAVTAIGLGVVFGV